MAELPRVAALWVGGSLGWLEQLCLKSFVDIGQPVSLYTYGEVGGVPEGVDVRDGNAILPTENFITHERSGSFALFSDLFRFHLMVRDPGVIWVDTDIYALRPLDVGLPHVFGYEAGRQMNGAVLGLPADSDALGLMLELTADEYAIPEFVSPAARAAYEARAEAGNPVHASEMAWGVWGPHGLTWALRKTGEERFAQKREVFYPVPFPERRSFFKRGSIIDAFITEDSQTVHIWGRIKRISAKRFGGGVKARCWLDMTMRKHGIDPAEALITTHGKFDYGDDDDGDDVDA